MDRGLWQVTVRGIAELDMTAHGHTHTHLSISNVSRTFDLKI